MLSSLLSPFTGRRLRGLAMAVMLLSAMVAQVIAATATTGPNSTYSSSVTLFEGNPPLCAGGIRVEGSQLNGGTFTQDGFTYTLAFTNTAQGQVFSYVISPAVSYVVVKGGNFANFFSYTSPRTTDSLLHAPVNGNNGLYFDISHIDFCPAGATIPPTQPPTPSVSGDPHVVGFHSQAFDFKGRAGATYSLIQSKDLSVNALLKEAGKQKGQTVIEAIGIEHKGARVELRSDGSLRVNDQQVDVANTKAVPAWLKFQQKSGELKLKLAPEVERQFYGRNGMRHVMSHQAVAAMPGFDMKIMAVESPKWQSGLKFLDISFDIKDDRKVDSLKLQGVLGETARSKHHVMSAQQLRKQRPAATDQAYEVKSLFAKLNKLQSKPAAAKVQSKDKKKK